jgi:hypothetical protein
MAFPVGAVLGGIGFLGDLIGGIKQRKENERLRREQQKQLQSQQAIAAAGRFDQDQGGGAGPTAGLSLRPQFGNLGMGMGTLSMFPPIGAQQQPDQTPMFQMQQPGQQQQAPPAPTYGGNFSPQLLDQGFNQPQAKQGQPQTAPAFNAIGAYLSNGRRG